MAIPTSDDTAIPYFFGASAPSLAREKESRTIRNVEVPLSLRVPLPPWTDEKSMTRGQFIPDFLSDLFLKHWGSRRERRHIDELWMRLWSKPMESILHEKVLSGQSIGENGSEYWATEEGDIAG